MVALVVTYVVIAGVGLARMNFCRRVCGEPWPQTRNEANKIIEALKAMRARGWKARGPKVV